jgi:hypothetical protein
VVAERAEQQWVIGVAVLGVGREQRLLLELEMAPAVGLPEVEEPRALGLGVLRRRTPQLQGDEQGLVMVAREGRQRLAALHRAVLSGSGRR